MDIWYVAVAKRKALITILAKFKISKYNGTAISASIDRTHSKCEVGKDTQLEKLKAGRWKHLPASQMANRLLSVRYIYVIYVQLNL